MILNFDFITFDEATHTYYNKKIKKKVPSVTTVLGKLSKPFDTKYMTAKKEKETGVPAEIIEWSWNCKRDVAANYGSRFHKYMEDMYNFGKGYGFFPSANKYFEDYKNDIVIKNEFRVGNHVIAGTFDNLSMRDGKYILKDWKTNYELSTESDYNLLPPFEYLDKSKLTEYSLQLSLYRVLLNIPIYKMELVHFKTHDYVVYDLPFMEREARMIIKNLENDNSSTRSRTKRIDKPILG